MGAKRQRDTTPASSALSDGTLDKRPRYASDSEIREPTLLTRDLDGVVAAGDDCGVVNADAVRFLCDHSVTWQEGRDVGDPAGWRLCVHPFLGTDVPLPTCFRLLRALAALLTEEPRPQRMFDCRTQPLFDSIASFSLDDCVIALEAIEYAQLPKVLLDRIVDHAVVGALGQVLCTPTPSEGKTWQEQCQFHCPTMGTLERAVGALVPDRLVTLTLACSEPQPVLDPAELKWRPTPPTGSDAELLVDRVLRRVNARAHAALGTLLIGALSVELSANRDPHYRDGLWGLPLALEAVAAPAPGSAELASDRAEPRSVNSRHYRSYLLGRILSGRPIPAGREAHIWGDSLPPSDLATAAAALGQVHTLQLLRFRGTPLTAAAFSAAARAGRTDSLQLLWDADCAVDTEACAAAAGAGNLPVLQWLRGRSPPCPWDESVCIRAVRAGHLPALQWAAAAGCPCGEKTLEAAITARQVAVIRWLCVDRRVGRERLRARILEEALRHCDHAMLKLAHELAVPFTWALWDLALNCRKTHGLRCVHAATAVGYDLLKAGLAAAAVVKRDRQLLRFAHAWGAEPNPATLAAAAGTDDVAILQEALALGHPMSADAVETAAARGAFRAVEWLLAAGCERQPWLYWDILQGCGSGQPEYTSPPSAFLRGVGFHRGTYQHDRFCAKQLQLMQSLHAERVPLPSDGLLWRGLIASPQYGTPRDAYHPVFPWLRGIGYAFPLDLAACTRDVEGALRGRQSGVLRLLREIGYPAAEGTHLWRAAVTGAVDGIRFLLSEKYPLPEPPGTLFAAAEFDAFGLVARSACVGGCELIDSLAAAGYPPSRTAMEHAASRGDLPLARALRQAQCLLTQEHVVAAWGGSFPALARWMQWQLDSRGPQAAEYTAEADKHAFSDREEDEEEDGDEDAGVNDDEAGNAVDGGGEHSEAGAEGAGEAAATGEGEQGDELSV